MDAADFEPLHPNDAWLMAQVDQNMFAAAVADGDDGDPIVPQPPVVPGLDQGDDDDRVTYEDSEMFEEDIVSLASDSESAIQNWRGWSGVLPIDCPHPELSATDIQASTSYGYGPPQTLRIMAAKVAALSMSFDQLEAQNDGQPIPSDVFIDVIRQCFPQNSEDIRMYSFLTNASGNEYLNGYQLFNEGCVKKALQIGYHITATVEVTPKQQTQTSDARGRASFGVDISVDRCRIVSCTCSCPFKSSWCQHVVAVCLHRIHHPNKVEYRGTIWDSLNQMSKKNLIKFSQYLINALPRQYLPIAQGLIDDLRNPDSDINQSDGAPDPTDGGHQEHAIWCLDGKVIKDNIHKVLTKICIPGPTVHCDVNCLSNNPSPTITEWQALYRSLKSKDPEGLWNLLAIGSDLLKRGDSNAINLLHIVTEELMSSEHVLYWWYITKLTQSGFWILTQQSKAHFQSANGNSALFNCASLCDEVVNMWRLAALNPKWTYIEREQLFNELTEYHRTAVTTISHLVNRLNRNQDILHNGFMFTVMDHNGSRLGPENARFSVNFFPGFFDALSACMIEWGLTNINAYLSGECPEFQGNFKATSALPSTFSASKFASEISIQYDVEMPCITDGRSRCSRRGIKKNRRITHRHSTHARHILQMDGSHAEANSAHGGPTVKHVRPSRNNPGRNVVVLEDQPTCSKNVEDARLKREMLLNADFEQIAESLNVGITNLDAKYATCEALMAHGYTQQARNLAVSVAEEMNKESISLVVQLDLMNGGSPSTSSGTRGAENPPRVRRKKPTTASPTVAHHNQNKFRVPESHVIEMSKHAAHLFSRAIFLTNVLSTDVHSRKVAYSLALAVLSAARGPAATRHLEVKLYYYEAALVELLRDFIVGEEELALIRTVALQILENSQRGRQLRVTVLPLTLIQYLLETLSESKDARAVGSTGKMLSDKELGFFVALEGLGMPLYVTEADHAMLCECVRRLRGEIALNLFMRYKDATEKLGLIVDKLLDPNVHRLYKNQESNAAYFLERAPSLRTYHKTGTRPRHPFEQYCAQEEQPSTSKSIHSTPSSASLSDATTPSTSSEDRSSQSSNDPDVQDDLSSVDSERGVRRSTDEGHESRDESPRFSDSSSSGFTTQPMLSFPSLLHKRDKNVKMPVQVPEPLATFLAELSKRLLNEAGGNQSTAIFNPHNGMQAHAGPHRPLHVCSFLIGLYALGLSNKMQLNWPTRTYSTQASWIHTQAIEIGRSAIEIIRHTWENHLTPTEVAALADKASQCREPGLVQEAALLALSVLPRANALTISESNRALDQCKEKGLLEQACEAVGKAADGDGVYPEVLFNVAHYWFDLSEAERDRTQDNTRLTINTNSPQHLYTDGFNSYRYEPTNSVQMSSRPPIPYVGPMIDVRRPPPNFATVPPPNCPPPVPQIQHPNPAFENANRTLHVSHSAPNLNPMHPMTRPFLGGAYVITSNPHGQTVMRSMYAQSPMAPRVTMAQPGQQAYYVPSSSPAPPLNVGYSLCPPGVSTSVPVPSLSSSSSSQAASSNLSPVGKRLFQAYRIGMRALEMMGGRADDRTYDSKRYSNPPHVDNVRWLEEKTGLLGKEDCYFKFCELAARSVNSPILLADLIKRAVHRHPPHPNPNLYSICNTPAPPPQPAQPLRQINVVNQHMSHPVPTYKGDVQLLMVQHGYHPSIAELMKMTVEQFNTAGATLLSRSNLTASDMEEVGELLKSFREIFPIIPYYGGMIFEEYVRFLRKQKACKKDVAARISEIVNGSR